MEKQKPSRVTSPGDLRAFLVNPFNSHAKESILMNKLLYDFKLAAALRGIFLDSYKSDVDREGFDIIFDDQDNAKKIQVKTVMQGSNTGVGNIHKYLLRPSLHAMDRLGFVPPSNGLMGGIILMELSVSNSELKVKYYYTDIMVLTAFHHNVIKRRNITSRKSIETVYETLHHGMSHDRIALPKCCLLSTTNAEQVLALAGFHNNISTGCWIYNLLEYSAHILSRGKHEIYAPADSMKFLISEEIKKCTDDNVIYSERPPRSSPAI